MGAQAAAPLDEACLKPLKVMPKISDDDEYWNILFQRRCVIDKSGEIPTAPGYIREAAKLQPDNVLQLCHIACVKLIDCLHRVTLKTLPPESLVTPLVLLSESLPHIVTMPAAQKFLSSMFDDCGVLSQTIVITFVKLLCFPGVTVRPELPAWCSTTDDDGTFDPVRSRVVDALLLLKVAGFEIVDFPKQQFAQGVFNAVLTYHFKDGMPCRYVDVRRQLIWSSMLLMFLTGSSFTSLELNEEAVRDLFSVIFTSVDRKLGLEDTCSFLGTLMCHTLFMFDVDVVGRHVRPSVLENVCHLCDIWREADSAVVCGMIIARLMQVPEFVSKLSSPCPEFGTDEPVHEGSWGSVMLEVTGRTWLCHRNNSEMGLACLVIGSKILSSGCPLVPVVVNTWLAVCSSGSDPAERVAMIRVLHWIVNHAWEHASTASILLRNGKNVKELCDLCPDCQEGIQLSDWIKQQNDKLKAIKERFSVSELIEALSKQENCVQTPTAPPEQIPVPKFEFIAHYLTLYDALTQDYFRKAKYLGVKSMILENGQRATGFYDARQLSTDSHT